MSTSNLAELTALEDLFDIAMKVGVSSCLPTRTLYTRTQTSHEQTSEQVSMNGDPSGRGEWVSRADQQPETIGKAHDYESWALSVESEWGLPLK